MRLTSWLTLTTLVISVTGCDWVQYNFMNSIPFHGDPSRNPVVNVYLGVDGLSYKTVQEAMNRGAFAGMGMHASKSISTFPGTSDYSWTRMMRTKKMAGYEISYYDPTADKIQNRGMLGVAKHVMPAITDSIDFEAQYLRAFDLHANGYTHIAEAYGDTFVSVAETLDNIFFTLSGRAETKSVFSAYMIETDVLGHMRTFEDVVQVAMRLSKRIEKFKKNHPERTFHFTLVSDHGMDFIKVPVNRIVTFSDEMRKVGVEPVDSLNGRNPNAGLYAVPIEHVRVSYLALHTHPQIAPDVAETLSRLESVDLAVSRIAGPLESLPAGVTCHIDWYGIYAEGALVAYYGFAPSVDQYFLPSGFDYSRLGLTLTFATDEKFKVISDDDLFKIAAATKYPDIFYRVRTGLSNVGIEYPADVLISFRLGYVERGFKVPLAGDDIASSGFHGALIDLASNGVVITDERELPDAVRADQLLDLFPAMREHAHELGVSYVEGDRNSSINF